MDSNDVRNRFRSSRRDYVGPMPVQRPAATPPTPKPVTKVDIQEPLEPREPHFQTSPKKKGRKRKILIPFLLILLIAGMIFGYMKLFKKEQVQTQVNSIQESTNKSVSEQKSVDTKQSIRLVATGDMIAHDAILKEAKQANGTYNFDGMLANMKPYFAKSDVNFCNESTPAGGSQFGITGYPIFNAPLEWPKALENVGCNVVNLGTNHTNDKGQPLIDATVAAWDNRPVLAVVGANRNKEEQAKIRYFEKGGVKFAILSYCTYSNSPVPNGFGINMYDKATATSQVAVARKNADIVIVSMRWGTEYSAGIDATQEKVSQELADAGADIVLGHGSHFMEPVKKLRGQNGKTTWVWYSLGNFLNAQLETESRIVGFAIMDIDASSKKISDPKFMPVYMHYEWTPAQKATSDLLARHNFSMYPLDKAAEPLSKSLLNTTVEAQTDRVTKLLNTYTPVAIIKSDQF